MALITTNELLEILEEYGIDGSIRTYPNKQFDPDVNSVVLGAPLDTGLKVIPPYKVVDQFGATQFITSGKGMTGFVNSSLPFVVESGMQITINGISWTVIGISPISTSDGIVFYLLDIEN